MRIEGTITDDGNDDQSHAVVVSIVTADGRVLTTHFKWVIQTDKGQNDRDVLNRTVLPLRGQSDAAAAGVLFLVANKVMLSERTFLPNRVAGEGNVVSAAAFELQHSALLAGEDGAASAIGFEGNDRLGLQVADPDLVEDDGGTSGELGPSVPSVNLSKSSKENAGFAAPSSVDGDGDGGTTWGTEPGAANEAPFAGTPASVGTLEDVTSSNIDVLSAAYDAEGDVLTVTRASASFGLAIINPDNTIDYTPDPDYNGPDTLTYTIVDSAGNSAPGALGITVVAVNDAPIVGTIPGQVTSEDAPVTTNVISGAGDVDGDALGVSAASAGNGFVTINPDQTLTYTPNADYNGSDTVVYTVSDGNGGTDTGSYGVTISPVNDAPRPVADAALVPEDGSVSINVLSNDTDIDGTIDPTTVQIVGTAAAGDPLAVLGEGTWSVNTTTGWISFTPEPDYDGTVSPISYTVQDDLGATSSPVSVSISLTPVNDAPRPVGNSGTVLEDGSIVIDVLANDQFRRSACH